MTKAHIVISLISMMIFLNSCAQDTKPKDVKESKEITEVAEEEDSESPYTEPHQYGGWYCPDNMGFEPMDVADLSSIKVITDRMPTKEETQNGTALMYLPKDKFPDARPLEIDLPALAYVKSSNTGMDELAIVIQAFIAGTDTIIGYRFPSGGNGSAWYGEATFLTADEASDLGSMPYCFEEVLVSATKSEIWDALTKTDFAKDLGKKFNEKALYKSEWSNEFNVDLEFKSDNEYAKGRVSAMWGMLYLQIDYYKNGLHSTQKMLVYEDQFTMKTRIIFVTGPFIENAETQNEKWADWLRKLKDSAEC